MGNRITAGIAKCQAQINDRIAQGLTTEKQVEDARQNLDMTPQEYVSFQNLKSAYMGSVITEQEAQTIYSLIGTTPDKFNNLTFAEKHVLSEVWAALLRAHEKSSKS